MKMQDHLGLHEVLSLRPERRVPLEQAEEERGPASWGADDEDRRLPDGAAGEIEQLGSQCGQGTKISLRVPSAGLS
jgi:hypothetical protein